MTVQLFGRNELANHAAAGAYGFLLSAAPAFLLTALLVALIFRSSPRAAAELFAGLGSLGGVMDSRAIAESYLGSRAIGASGIFAAANLLWTARVFALSLQRGLRVVFSGDQARPRPVRDNLMPFGIELAAVCYVLAYVLWSRLPTAPLFRPLFPLAGLGLLSYAAYRFVPSLPPKRGAAVVGAALCALAFAVVSYAFGSLIDTSRYNLVYGALGGLILLLANVYFFFTFFYMGAQLAFVLDTYDALVFARFRRMRGASGGNALERRLFASPEGPLKKYLRSYAAGDLLFEKGDTREDVFYILSGTVGIYLDEAESAVSVASIGAGSFLGEMAYLLSEPRTAGARAEEDVLALVLPADLFEDILKTDGETGRHVIASLSERLKNANSKLL